MERRAGIRRPKVVQDEGVDCEMNRTQILLIGAAVVGLVLTAVNYSFASAPLKAEVARIDRAIVDLCQEADIAVPSDLSQRSGRLAQAVNVAYGQLNDYLDRREAAAGRLGSLQRKTLAYAAASFGVGLLAPVLPRRPRGVAPEG